MTLQLIEKAIGALESGEKFVTGELSHFRVEVLAELRAVKADLEDFFAASQPAPESSDGNKAAGFVNDSTGAPVVPAVDTLQGGE